MSERILVVSELFYPDQTSTAYIMTEIASELGRQRDVEVFCGPKFNASNLEATSQDLSHLKITRVSSKQWDKNKLGSRIIRLVSLSLKLAWTVYRKSKKGDKILLVTNPAPLLLLISVIAGWKGLKFVVIVHDVFPENLAAAGILSENSLLNKPLQTLFNGAYAKADQLIVLGRDMRELMQEKLHANDNSKIFVIPNWADITDVYPIERKTDGKIRLQFAGNFGRVQGLIPLLHCIKEAQNDCLSFDFIGDGAMEQEMKDYCENNNLSSVNILPPFRRSQQLSVLNNCDIGIVTLAQGMKGLGVPSKTYNIMAAGKPILFVGDEDSEVYRLVEEKQIGWCFSNYGRELIGFLKNFGLDMNQDLRMKGERAREVAESRFSKGVVLAAYSNSILSL